MMRTPSTYDNEQLAVWDLLWTKLVTLDERVWEGNADGARIEGWLKNFTGKSGANADLEQLHALYLLSQFMYYGAKEIRVLLKALYRELFLIPLSQTIRSNTQTAIDFSAELNRELEATRFLGVGNPSESGVHLLYYFRQENLLNKKAFLDSAQIYKYELVAGQQIKSLRYPHVKRYVFLDDMCGSGETAERYSKDLLPDLLRLKPDAEVFYFALFATKVGLSRVRTESVFAENCGAVYELDQSFQWTDSNSRYLSNLPSCLHRSLLVALPYTYGEAIWLEHPLGYLDGQLLLGFFHNTPDNTLPIIWSDLENGSETPWYPAFRRYPKI